MGASVDPIRRDIDANNIRKAKKAGYKKANTKIARNFAPQDIKRQRANIYTVEQDYPLLKDLAANEQDAIGYYPGETTAKFVLLGYDSHHDLLWEEVNKTREELAVSWPSYTNHLLRMKQGETLDLHFRNVQVAGNVTSWLHMFLRRVN